MEENYDRLHYPPEGAARDARYTRYLNDAVILRTQTSAMIPSALDDSLLTTLGRKARADLNQP